MGEYFRVKTEELKALTNKVSDAAESMEKALNDLQDATKNLGTTQLDDACNHLQEEWRHGLSLITDTTEKIGKSINESVRLYVDTDTKIADKFKGKGEQSVTK